MRPGERRSAGLLLYRWPISADAGDEPEVLLGHLGGPYWAAKEAGAWTVPKGEHADDEDPLAAAVREFTEEVGSAPPPGPDLPLGTVRQRGGKTVTAWARAGDLDVTRTVSNTFEMEWPPRSGRRQLFPELDRLRWWPVSQGRAVVIAAQAELLDRLLEALRRSSGHRPP